MTLVATSPGVLTILLMLAMLAAAAAQPASGDQPLDDRQLLGMRLFNQSCRVCHTKPQMMSRFLWSRTVAELPQADRWVIRR